MKNIFTLILSFVVLEGAAQNLVAHYPLNGNATEMIGALNGTIQGAPTAISDRFSNPNGAFLFDGIDDCITIASSPVNTTTNLSVAFWMFTSSNSVSAEPVLLGVDDCIGGPSLNGYSVYAGGSTSFSAFPGNGLTIAVSSVQFLGSGATLSPIGTWDFIVAQNNAGVFELYKNGVLVMSGVAAMQGAPNAIRIGSGTNCRFFPGAVDDVQIYDAPLTPAQVTALYNLQAPLPLVFSKFEAALCNSQTCLTWQTQTETNVSHYIIERSTNGFKFEDLAELTALNLVENTYTYTDHEQPTSSTRYYCIKGVDIDGTVTYSHIEKIVSQSNSQIRFNNPVKNEITLLNAGHIEHMSLCDLTGKVLLHTSNTSGKISLPVLPSGLYLLVLESAGGTETHKVSIR